MGWTWINYQAQLVSRISESSTVSLDLLIFCGPFQAETMNNKWWTTSGLFFYCGLFLKGDFSTSSWFQPNWKVGSSNFITSPGIGWKINKQIEKLPPTKWFKPWPLYPQTLECFLDVSCSFQTDMFGKLMLKGTNIEHAVFGEQKDIAFWLPLWSACTIHPSVGQVIILTVGFQRPTCN